METWRERKTGIVPTGNTNGSDDEEEGNEAELEERHVVIGVCGDGDWADGMAGVFFGCASKANEDEGAVDIVL